MHNNSAKHLKICTKVRECTKWAQKKAEALQAEETQCHKKNYDKQSKTVALEVGDMVLVSVTAFKGHHKIQNRWENSGYVVEKWPYPDVPVYVICPRDGEGCSWTLHRNYFFPLTPTIVQDEKDATMAAVENNNTPAPVPPVDSEPADAGLSGMVTPSTTGSTPKGSPNQPVPLRHGTQKTQNQLLWRYQNFVLQADIRPLNIWDAWAGLHAISGLYNAFWGSTV